MSVCLWQISFSCVLTIDLNSTKDYGILDMFFFKFYLNMQISDKRLVSANFFCKQQ